MNRKRFDAGTCVQIMLLMRGGVSVRTNLMYFTGCQWSRLRSLTDKLIEFGYIVNDGDKLFLTNKGKEFLSFVDRYMDLFAQDLNKYFKYN